MEGVQPNLPSTIDGVATNLYIKQAIPNNSDNNNNNNNNDNDNDNNILPGGEVLDQNQLTLNEIRLGFVILSNNRQIEILFPAFETDQIHVVKIRLCAYLRLNAGFIKLTAHHCLDEISFDLDENYFVSQYPYNQLKILVQEIRPDVLSTTNEGIFPIPTYDHTDLEQLILNHQQ
ncbi:hypothetical protein CYY_000312 [Polysphondylium violaceum]|uniref:Uncharacterized protein n=1 Tax=Polysphondylium violaceum TaxID=133409 RepID=A0A8J4V5M9_9MYCE|nr:hypothetical protein CYY_000312 [Polysphondylium violaceum]